MYLQLLFLIMLDIMIRKHIVSPVTKIIFLKSFKNPVKKRRNWHRHDYTEIDDGSKPVQAGTRTFIKELRSRVFPRYGNLLW